MYQSPYNSNFIIPDLEKFECNDCQAEFILSTQYENSKAKCPYCQSENIGATVAMTEPEQLDELGCLAISLNEECEWTKKDPEKRRFISWAKEDA